MNSKKSFLAGFSSCMALIVVCVSFMGMMPSGGGGDMPGGADGDSSSSATVVETVNPERDSITVSASYVGTAEPGQSVTVYPKASGELTSVNFSVGDEVSAGDVLFQVDSTTLQNTIAQTQATIASSEASAALQLEIAQQSLEDLTVNVDEGLNSTLIQAQSSVTSAEASVTTAEANVASAELALEQANNNYRIARNEYSDYISGKSDNYDEYSTSQATSLRNAQVQAELNVESAQLSLENAKTSLETALINLETAKTSLAAAERQVEESAVSAQNSVRSAEISADLTASYLSLQQLQTQLSDYTATAPISGVVQERYIDPYDVVTTSTAAYVISNTEAMTISFSVVESALKYMDIGDIITVEKDGESWYGTVSEISGVVTSGGLYTVKATVSDAPFELYAGSTVKVYADIQKVEDVIVIPIDSLYYDNGIPYVYLFQQGTAVKQEIETGLTSETHIEVVSGLTLSDDVICTWSASLYDGAEVYLPGTAPADFAEDEDDETADIGETDEAAETAFATTDQDEDEPIEAGEIAADEPEASTESGVTADEPEASTESGVTADDGQTDDAPDAGTEEEAA